MADLADRVIVDSAASENHEACLREIAALIEDPEMPAIGDLQWVGLSPWRSLLADTFGAPERAGDLEKIERAEILYAPGGENRALFPRRLARLHPGMEARERNGGGQNIEFSGPTGRISVVLSPDSPDARLRRIRLYSEEYSFQVSRHRELSDVRTTVMRGDELLAERTVHLGSFDLGVLVGEELRYRGRDEAYEGALRKAVEILERASTSTVVQKSSPRPPRASSRPGPRRPSKSAGVSPWCSRAARHLRPCTRSWPATTWTG